MAMVKESGTYNVRVTDSSNGLLVSGLYYVEVKTHRSKTRQLEYAQFTHPESGQGTICRLSFLHALEIEGKVVGTEVTAKPD